MRLTRSFLQKLPAESYVRSMNFSEARITECDVFISHSYENKKVVGRLYSLFQHCGYRPFVDWIDTDLTDRSQMNASGARLLRKVLARSKIIRSLVSVFLGPANPRIISVERALSLTKSFLTVLSSGVNFSSNFLPCETFLELKFLAAS